MTGAPTRPVEIELENEPLLHRGSFSSAPRHRKALLGYSRGARSCGTPRREEPHRSAPQTDSASLRLRRPRARARRRSSRVRRPDRVGERTRRKIRHAVPGPAKRARDHHGGRFAAPQYFGADPIESIHELSNEAKPAYAHLLHERRG